VGWQGAYPGELLTADGSSCGKYSAKDEDNGLTPKLLLDTPRTGRWLVESKRLSREQIARAPPAPVRRCEPLALSAITLLEIAVLFGEGQYPAEGPRPGNSSRPSGQGPVSTLSPSTSRSPPRSPLWAEFYGTRLTGLSSQLPASIVFGW